MHTAAVVLTVLLAAAPACADVPSIDLTVDSSRNPGRPVRPARPTRPSRPGRLNPAPAPGGGDTIVPDPATPVIEPPAGTTPEAPPTAVPGEEGDLRLVGRVDINGFATGALQLFHDGAYGAVCIEGFDAAAADVACRQLGFIGGTNIPLAIRGNLDSRQQRSVIESILAPMVLENLACTGTEERLVDCPGSRDPPDYAFMTPNFDPDYVYTYYGARTEGCDPLEATYAFVACGTETGPNAGDLRLTGGLTSEDGNSQFGRLEVFNDGGWGTVCDRTGRVFSRNRGPASFSDVSVDVACQQLGFAQGSKTQPSQPTISLDDRRVPTWLAGAACDGTEAALTDCPGVAFGNNTQACGLGNVLVILCFNTAQSSGRDGELRLMQGGAGPGYEYGRLEIFLRGFWSTICDTDGFTPDSAQVACSILGFDGGSSIQFRQPYSGFENQVLAASLPVGLASVDCNGTETSLLDCTSSQNDLQQCGIFNTNLTDATVLACADTLHSCDKTPPMEEGSVRLRGGFGTPCDPVHTGFVEVFHFDEWGAICGGADGRDWLAANVICRQLGFPHGTLVDPLTNSADRESTPNEYGGFDYPSYIPEEEEASEEQDRFWLNWVQCRGPEEKLLECNLGQGFRNTGRCTGDRVVRLTVACRTFPVTEALEDVTTPGAEEGDLRLVDEVSVSNWKLGRLEVFFEGSWSQVCAREFDGPDADVACRQLGFGAGSVGPNRGNGAPAMSDRLVFPEVALTTPGCDGTEDSLLDCGPFTGFISRFTDRGCFGEDVPGLALACVATPEEGEERALRLTDGGDGGTTSAGRGVLEIFHAGAWGTFCEGEGAFRTYDYGPALTESAAALACRQLGFEGGVFADVTSVPANVTLLPAWLGAVPCVGNEATLADCGPLQFGNTETCGLTQRLVCTSAAGPGSGPSRGEARLTGGSADPGGAWAYGRLEVSDGEFFSSIREQIERERIGRRGVQVACRSLGFSAGAQILSTRLSALPGPSGEVDTLTRIECQGDEATLADCELAGDDNTDYGAALDAASVAVLCSNPSGCSSNDSSPSQGDVRLVDLSGVTAETAPCDAVHFGGVEFFNDGLWGRICSSPFGAAEPDFTIDANVVCRQLGFPFGSLIDIEEPRNSSGITVGADYGDYNAPGDIVWATDVVCTGKETRLDECFFPEDFGDAPRNNDFGLPVENGVRRARCRRRDGKVLAVACRQFEIEESNVIRRL